MDAVAGRKARGRLSSALLASTVLALGCGVPAYGQEVPILPPHVNVDENGVDNTTGQFVIGVPLGSVGAGTGMLSLVEYFGGLQGNNLQVGFRRVVNACPASAPMAQI